MRIAVVALVLALASVARAETDAERLAHLTHRRDLLRAANREVAEGNALKRVRQDAVDLREQAIQPLRDFDSADAILAAWGTRVDLLKDRGTLHRGEEVVQLVSKTVKEAADLIADAEKLEKPGTSRLERLAHDADILKGALGSLEVIGLIDPAAQKLVEGQIGGVLSVAEFYQATRSWDDVGQRNEHLQKAYKHARDSRVAAMQAGGRQGAAQYALIAAGLDAIWRVSHFGLGYAKAAGLERDADTVQSQLLNLGLYQSMVVDWQRDQLLAKREPGGIKLSGQIADHLAASLDVNAVQYDPVRRSIRLAVAPAKYPVPLSVFSDVLKLARERFDPTFSLESVASADWDRMGIRGRELLEGKYRGAGSWKRLVKRMQQVGSRLDVRGVTFLNATLEDVDPLLSRELERELDTREELVFSPRWLAFTRLGWILYEADMAIKAVAAGYLEGPTGQQPAGVWDIPGFEPMWWSWHGAAGRANFELDPQNVPERGGVLDLGELRPRLVMVHRAAGTSTDLPPCKTCERVSAHFTEHWREFADRVPAIGRLHQVLQAYVGARMLLARHPGLAACVDRMPRPEPDERPRFLDRSDATVRLCLDAKGKPFPWRGPESDAVHVTGGYAGGITIHAPSGPAAPVDADPAWERKIFDGRSYELTMSGETLSPVAQGRLWIACLGAALGLLVLERRRVAGAWRALT